MTASSQFRSWAFTLGLLAAAVGALVGIRWFVNPVEAPPVPSEKSTAGTPPTTAGPVGPATVRALPEGHEDVPVETSADDASPEGWKVSVRLMPSTDDAELSFRIYLVRHSPARTGQRQVVRKGLAAADKPALFANVDPGRYDVQVRSSGWVAQDEVDIEYAGGPGATEVAVYRLAALACRLYDEQQRPVEGATVAVYPPSNLLPYFAETISDEYRVERHHSFPLLRKSDQAGSVQFTDLPPGDGYWIRAESQIHASVRVNDVKLAPGETQPVDVQLLTGAFVTGRLVNYDGSPSSNGTARALRPYNPSRDKEIQVERGGATTSEGWLQERMDQTNENGEFRIGPLTPGTIRVQLHSAEDGVHAQVQRDVQVRPGEVYDLGTIGPRYPPVEFVFVCDGFNHPGDLQMMINPMPQGDAAQESPESGLIQIDVAQRDRVNVQNLMPGRVAVIVTSRSRAIELFSTTFDITNRPQRLELWLRSAQPEAYTATIRVSVTPVPDFESFFGAALILPGEYPANLRYNFGVIPADAGNGALAADLAFRKRTPGNYTLWITDGNRCIVKSVSVTGSENEVLVMAHMADAAGACEFRVRSIDGLPVADAQIEWFWNDEHLQASEKFGSPYLISKTNSEGIALVKGYPANHGSLVFRVHAQGYRSETVRARFGSTVDSPAVEHIRLTRG
ncbi:MAG: carboxypeptidase regulatory-like domain-containing protein [Planctomycetes bacterium]|nr:carboxypeptidase regulatory-like domain-containing protein [Planctomycetota bacterium]